MALHHDAAELIVLWVLVLNAGIGCALASLPNLVIAAVGPHQTGEATGVNTIARNIGASLGGQISASIVATHVLAASGNPDDRGFVIAFLMSAGVTLVAAFCGLLIPRDRTPLDRLPPAMMAASALPEVAGSSTTV
jgi:MFS family permease